MQASIEHKTFKLIASISITPQKRIGLLSNKSTRTQSKTHLKSNPIENWISADIVQTPCIGSEGYIVQLE